MDRYHKKHRSSRDHRRSPSESEDKEFTLRELKEKARREIISSRRNEQHVRDRRDHRHDYQQDYNHFRKRHRSRSPNKSRNHMNTNRGDSDYNRSFNRRRSDNESRSYDSQKFSDGKNPKDRTETEEEKPPPEIKPNFELTGALARDTNTFNGIVIKYNQPPEANKPTKRWRLYPFKGAQALDFIPIHKQSAYLLGRERKVVDIPIDHPSCSKQHAVIQFRSITIEKPDGTTRKATRPYLIDLESANGTFVNSNKIEPRRYIELLERDVIKFGFSTREYVLLHEHSDANDEVIESNIGNDINSESED